MSGFPTAQAIAVDTLAILSALRTLGDGAGGLFSGYKNGTCALVAETGELFILQTSSAPINGTTVLRVNDDSLRRWKVVSGAAPPAGVTEVTGVEPIESSGGDTPAISAPALARNLWFRQAQDYMKSLVPEVTAYGFVNCEEQVVALAPTSPVGTTYEGGSTITGGNTKKLFGRAITTKPKTGRLAIEAQILIKGPQEGRVAQFGLFNNTGAHWVIFGTDSGLSVNKFIMQIFNGSTWTPVAATADADGELHTVTLALNEDGWNMAVDHVIVGATDDLDDVSDEAMYVGIANTVQGDVEILRFAYAYVAPT